MSGSEILYAWNREHGGMTAAPGLPPQPRSRVAIVTCMDTRLVPSSMFGVRPGDVHVIRNAGGIVTDDTVRSLVISQSELDTDEVMVVMHTKCGMLGLNEREVRARVQAVTGRTPTFELGSFSDLGRRLQESIEGLRRNSLIDADVRGFVFDVDTGLVEELLVR